jgi:hypothetical protein
VREHEHAVLRIVAHGIALKIEQAKVLELAQLHQVLELLDGVVADGKAVNLCTGVKSRDGLNIVVVERNVLQFSELLQPFDFADIVERQIKPLQIDKMLEVDNFLDNIVIQAQHRQLLKALEVVDPKDICKRKLGVGKAFVRTLRRHVLLNDRRNVVASVIISAIVIGSRLMSEISVFLRLSRSSSYAVLMRSSSMTVVSTRSAGKAASRSERLIKPRVD